MKIRNIVKHIAVLIAFVGVLDIALPAFAETSELELARTSLAAKAEELKLVREQITVLEEMLESGRFYVAPVPVIGEMTFTVVTRDLAIKYWTFHYIMSRSQQGKPFVTAEVAEVVKELLKTGRVIKTDIDASIAALEARERQLMNLRRDLEQTVSDLQGPQSTGRCVDLQRVDRQRALGIAAYVNRGARMHYLNQNGPTGRGWNGSFALTWTEPPDRICAGETFEISLTATNNGPVQDTLGRAAQVSMTFKPGTMDAACTNPPPFDPDAAAFVSASDATYSNTCTVTVDFVGDGTKPMDLIHMSLSAIPQIGSLAYIYQ